MTPTLLLVALLFFVWLMVRLSRKANVPPWLKLVRSLFLLAAIAIGVYYCWFRVQRSQADVDRSRKTAAEVVAVMGRYETDKDIASAIVSPLLGREVIDSVEALVDMANDGDLRQLRQAAQDARYCLAEVDREVGPVELLFFTQPTPCRAMFLTLGEPGELADAGMTFGDMATRAGANHRPGEPEGPACREWKIANVELTLPNTKESGESWDIGDGLPDPVVSLRVGAGQRLQSPVTQDQRELRWRPSPPVLATPGSKLELRVYDSDAIEDDFAFDYETTVPTNAESPWVVGKRPNEISLSLECVR